MQYSLCNRNVTVFTGSLVICLLLLLPPAASAGEEVASAIRRYLGHEVSTGYYEKYEVLPRHKRSTVGIRSVREEPFRYSSTAATVRNRRLLADSHRGIKFYATLRCRDCHVAEAHDIHTTRANLTCRQCHGGEPIASIDHYFSPMNPIRRHAYVCAKCHEGASASFAQYVVHEPPAGSSVAKANFPALYYTYWFMLVLLGGTLAFFIPHSILTGFRELISKGKESKK